MQRAWVCFLWMVGAPAMLFCSEHQRFTFSLELNGHVRNSKAAKFPIPFPFPPQFLPPGETNASLETVDAGEHLEFSRASLLLDYRFSDSWRGFLKADLIDRYDRNPTSGDNQADIDEAWIRYGSETAPGEMPGHTAFYAKFGKFGKFERQDDRNLESYGLISTSFNRFEDAGLELGIDFNKYFYAKASYTTGNPVFFRDPNTLAGDNGTEEGNPNLRDNPVPILKSGFVIFYDAEIEDLDFDSGAETGIAAGFRLGDEFGRFALNFMAFHYQRDLREEVNLTGTFYGGDLDLLRGPDELDESLRGLPLNGVEKDETGANLWLYFANGSVFAQFVDSEMAGLQRDGWEIEAAWSFDLPLVWAYGSKQLFSRITPVVRISELSPGFTGNARLFPTPSVWWKWRKRDWGVVVDVINQFSLTIEYAENEFLRAGVFEQADEFLMTASWKWSSRKPN